MLKVIRVGNFRPLAILAVIWGGMAGGLAQEGGPPTLGEDPDGGTFLFIPGLGRIPGARGLPPAAPPLDDPGARAMPPGIAQPKPQPPISAQERAATDMNRLFERLAEAEDERDAQGAAAAILRRWAQSGSDTVDLLAARARAAEEAGALALARALLDYVVTLSPAWPEGYVRRARVAAAQGDGAAALGDLETAARLEPRRFDALETIGALAEKAGDKRRALDAYRRALDIAPRDAALRREEERLRLEVEGRGI